MKLFRIIVLKIYQSLCHMEQFPYSSVFNINLQCCAVTEPPESWKDREPTDTEVMAVTILQAGFKGHLVREIFNASKPGKTHPHTHPYKMYAFKYKEQVYLINFESFE